MPSPVQIEFSSEGATLRGRLFLPSSPAPAPVVIMAHGFSATAHGMVADRYAQAFADHGVAALLYDHRGLGRSDGEPRGEIDPWLQARGYLDALDAVAGLGQVCSGRAAVWGDSYSAAQALAVAAVDDRVRAVELSTRCTDPRRCTTSMVGTSACCTTLGLFSTARSRSRPGS